MISPSSQCLMNGEWQKNSTPSFVSENRGGSGWLDSLGHSLSGAWRVADYAAVSRVVRLSEYTWSGVWPSSA